MAVFALGDRRPQLADPVWVADSASVIGSVSLERNASVFFGAVVRGDNAPITIGEATNIQDNAVLHTDEGVPLALGRQVTVGHQVMLHGCTIGDGSLIGIGAIVLNRAVIGRHCLVGAGTLIPEGKTYPDRSLIVGTPGKVIRELTDEDVQRVLKAADHYIEQWQCYRSQLVRID